MRLILSAAAAVLLASCQPAAADKTTADKTATAETKPTIQVADASCRPTPNGRDVTACYVTLTASGDDRLILASSPLAGQTEMHRMSHEGGMMKMAPIEGGLALPAGHAVALKSGGDHLMLMKLSKPLAAGDRVPLTLSFERADSVQLLAPVGQPAG